MRKITMVSQADGRCRVVYEFLDGDYDQRVMIFPSADAAIERYGHLRIPMTLDGVAV